MTRVLVTGGSGFIGTRVVDDLLAEGHEVRNFDLKSPPQDAHRPFWRNLNLADAPGLMRELNSFQPEAVIHMAARTDTLSRSLDDYRENIVGTENLIEAIKDRGGSLTRAIFFSTQFVNQSAAGPRDDLDFAPHTCYGESKVLNEQAIRAADLSCAWTIVRPTNIWGPWHPRYPHEFWRVLKKGLYVHPGGAETIRSYGYVGNVSAQTLAILKADRTAIDRQVFYLGDAPLNLFDWANGFSERLTGRSVIIVPRPVLRGLALIGDLLAALGLKFPLTSSRFESMTTDNPAPMERTLALLGPPKYDLSQGISETVAWLVAQDPVFWRLPEPAPNHAARGLDPASNASGGSRS